MDKNRIEGVEGVAEQGEPGRKPQSSHSQGEAA